MQFFDIAVIGAGAAGLSFAHHLAAAGPTPPTVALVEPSDDDPRRAAPRTWCYWEAGPGAYDDLLTASWDAVDLCSADGTRSRHPMERTRYKMLRSDVFTEAVGRRLDGSPNVRRITGAATRITAGTTHNDVTVDHDGRAVELRAHWVFDSRPRLPQNGARTVLWQHFRGWFVTTDRPVFDPAAPLLMDFRVPQPDSGLAFGYVLPLHGRRALVEYTVFSRAPWPESAYDAALDRYLCAVLGSGDHRIEAVESGIIPMADAPRPRSQGPRHFLIGAAGGAVRPSTGYSFATSQRQARAAAAHLSAGRPPVPPRPYPRRHLLLDAVLLRALDRGRLGPDFFTRLFRTHRTDTVVRFLDGTSTRVEELAVGVTSPLAPMLRSCLDVALHRLQRTGPTRTELP